MRKLNFFLALGLLLASLCANAANEVYSIVQDGNTLVFFYDGKRETYPASQYPTLYNPNNKPGERFAGYNAKITSIHLDESMKNATFTSLVNFFGGSTYTNALYNVTQITHLDYLNTSGCSSMSYMFNGMKKLESVDLSKFNTSNVQYMSCMFRDCQKLVSLDLSSFNTAKVIYMSYMFYGCNSVKTFNVSSFNTAKVVDMNSMFHNCLAVKILDISNFDMQKVTEATYMFAGGMSLTTIICTSDWSNALTATASANMFNGCTKLVGGNGTTYNASYMDKTYARPDRGTTAPGYFSFPAAVQNVINLIYAIGTVEYTTDCYQKIMAASTAWGNLTDAQKALIADDKKVINDAIKTYYALSALNTIDYYKAQNADASAYALSMGYDEVRLVAEVNQPHIIDCWNAIIPGTTTASDVDAILEEAKGYYFQTVAALINTMKADIKTSIDALAVEGDSEACKAIINNAKQEVNDFTWDYNKTVNQNIQAFDNQFSQDWFLQVKADLQTQRNTEAAIKAEKEKLYAAIVDLSAMKIFARDNLADTELTTEIDNSIIAAQAVYDDPNATLAEVQTAVKNANDAIADFKEEMLPEAKAGFKAGLNGLLKPGDNQQCKDIVAAAVAQVDVLIVWDDTKNATQNIVNLVQIAQKLYNDTKAAVEAARTSTNFEAVQQSAIRNQKIIRNGQLLIIRDGKTFNAAGAEL